MASSPLLCILHTEHKDPSCLGNVIGGIHNKASLTVEVLLRRVLAFILEMSDSKLQIINSLRHFGCWFLLEKTLDRNKVHIYTSGSLAMLTGGNMPISLFTVSFIFTEQGTNLHTHKTNKRCFNIVSKK